MKRRLAREFTVQSLYQMEMNGVPATQAVHTVLQDGRDDDDDGPVPVYEPQHIEFVLQLVTGVTEHSTAIDQLLAGYLKGWRMERLSRVDRQILRLAAYEMFYRDDTPAKVAINEAIELSKHFGTEESGRFVNGVLGKMVKDFDQIREQMNIEQKQ